MAASDEKIYKLAKEGEWKKMKGLLSIKNMYYKCPDENMNSIMIAAVLSNSLKTIKLCINNLPVDILNYQNYNGYTCLHYGVLSKDISILQAIIHKQPDFSIQDNFGETALHKAARLTPIDDIQILKDIIYFSENMINCPDNFGCTPIFYALEVGWLESVELLINAGADIDHKAIKGYTAQHLMTMKRNYDAISMLLKFGANCQINDQFGKTALDYADSKASDLYAEYGYIQGKLKVSMEMCGSCLAVRQSSVFFSKSFKKFKNCSHIFCSDCQGLECIICSTGLDNM